MAGITRRSALQRLAVTAASAYATSYVTAGCRPRDGLCAAEPQAENPSVVVSLDEEIGKIQPGIYGQFVEHIGGVIYDGIWVGRDSKIANTNGVRQAVIDHLRRLGPTVVRWPGGCFADKYHWRDGIGDAAKRPRRFGRWKEDTEPNSFGTHEFMEFCRLCRVQPYLAANVGSGSVEEFQQWIEYCNSPAKKTTLADERVANGQSEPFGIRYWGVGNESWGCGGKFTPEDYCTEYRKFTDWLPSYGVPLYLIAAGPNSNDIDWTKRFFKKWVDYARAPLQGWAAHYYCGTTGHALEFSHDQWYEMLLKANAMGKLIADQWAVMGEFDRERKVKLVIDEWGCWHPPGTEINKQHLYEQMGCLRDALAAALTLDTFNRHADKIDMANIAQMVNCLQSLFLADEDKFVATPNFHVFEMYRPHQGATAIRAEFQASEVTFKTAEGPRKLFRLNGSASRRDKAVTLTLVHTHAAEPVEVSVQLRGGKAKSVRQTVLSHARLNAHNTFEHPEEIIPKTADTAARGAEFVCTFPPAAVVRLDIELG